MKSLNDIFLSLKNESPAKGESYIIAQIPHILNHKIGITKYGQPIFFIKCDDSINSNILDANLEFIAVQYNLKCQLISGKDEVKVGIYTIIYLKDGAEYLQEYFIKVVYVLLQSISEKPSLKALRIEVEKLINLFSKFSKPPIKSIQGVWAELLVIEQSNIPDYLIISWHKSINDKYDFNDGTDKIEVKSTSKSRRVHNFSQEQLITNPSSSLIIVSIFTIETGVGKNIFHLIDRIAEKIVDKDLKFKLLEMIVLTLGNDFEKSRDVFFDYNLAVNSIKFYNSVDIPKILGYNIPTNISNVRFDCDLTDVNIINKDTTTSKLHTSLF